MLTSFSKLVITLALAIGVLSCDQIKNVETPTENIEPGSSSIKRYGSVIKIKPEMLERYKQLHANPWKDVSEQIKNSNIRNYSIYLKDDYLFGYFEYIGDNFEADMEKMAQDSVTQEWWKLTDPCQIPLDSRKPGEWWASMEEVFHQD